MDKNLFKNLISFSITTIIIILINLNWCHGLDTSTFKPSINDGFSRRELNLKVEDNLPTKSNDPPPEYYRGPGSSSTSPLQFPDRDRNHRDRNPDSSNVIGLQRPHGFQPRYPPKGGSTNSSPQSPNTHERIGHYGSAASSEYTGNSGYGSSIAEHIPYGPPQPIDFPGNYGGGQTSHLPSGIYEHGYELDHKGYLDYDSHHGYPPPPPPLNRPVSNYYEEKLRFTKSFLLPIAGAAIIGLAAALITNPVLLHLGTVGTNVLGRRRRRKRRSFNENYHQSKQLYENDNNYDAHRLAYRATKLSKK